MKYFIVLTLMSASLSAMQPAPIAAPQLPAVPQEITPDSILNVANAPKTSVHMKALTYLLEQIHKHPQLPADTEAAQLSPLDSLKQKVHAFMRAHVEQNNSKLAAAAPTADLTTQASTIVEDAVDLLFKKLEDDTNDEKLKKKYAIASNIVTGTITVASFIANVYLAYLNVKNNTTTGS